MKYIRVDVDLVANKEADGYAPAAIAAYVALLCAGATQSPRGIFKNETVLRGHLGQFARWTASMIVHDDLRKLPDGRLEIVGWEQWQEGNILVAERMRRVRERQKARNGESNAHRNEDRNGESNAGANSTVTPPPARTRVTGNGQSAMGNEPPVRNGGPPLTDDALLLLRAMQQVTGRPWTPTDELKALDHLGEFSARLTPQHMADCIRGNAAWCLSHGKRAHSTMAGYREALRLEYDHHSDKGRRVTTETDVPDRDPDDLASEVSK